MLGSQCKKPASMSKTSLKKFLLRRPVRFTVEWKWDEGAPGEVRGDEVALVSLADPAAPALAPHPEEDRAEEVAGSAKEPSAVLPLSGTVPPLEKQEEEEVAPRAHPSAASEALPPEAEEDEDEDAIEAVLKAAEAEEEAEEAAAAAQYADEVAAYLSENPRTNMQALGYHCKKPATLSQMSLKEIVLRQGLTLTSSRTLIPFSINLSLFVIEASQVIVQRSSSSRLS